MKKVLSLKVASQDDLLAEANVSGLVLKAFEAKRSENLFVVVRLEHEIVGYEFSENSGKFIFKWKKNAESTLVDSQLLSYPLWLSDIDSNGVDEIICREKDGLKIYGMTASSDGLGLMGKSDLFHDTYGKNLPILIGNFYANPKLIGLMRRNKSNASAFYVFKGDCLGKQNCEVLRKFSKELILANAWKSSSTSFQLTQLDQGDLQEVFALRTQSGLDFYKFNKSFDMEKVLNESLLETSLGLPEMNEKILFGNFTNQPYQDVLHLNSSGLFLYKFDTSVSDYTILNYASEFSVASGWADDNSKTFFVGDLDGDKKSDILFTGINGIAIKSFNTEENAWDNTLNAGIRQSERFAKIVGIVKSPGPFALLQSSNGSLKHAELVSEIVEDFKAVTVKPTRTDKKISADGFLSVYDIEKVPKSPISSSGSYRWTEQWARSFEEKFFKNVPYGDGFVAFNIPLIDMSLSHYLKVQLSLSYSDRSQSSNILGFGWNIPLMNNHIQVDYQCSVFAEDSVFSFYGLGRRIILKRDTSLETGDNIMRFTVSGHDEMDVYYHSGLESYWIIETTTERFVYGMDDKNGAVQMNLSWENTRCGKSDTSTLKQLPVAWFVKERRDKINEKSIYYRYNKEMRSIVPNGERFTHSLSLKSINDDKNTLVQFEYITKTALEVSKIETISNDRVVFPTTLADDFFLSKISIQDERHSQSFQFEYKVKAGVRLFIGFSQVFPQNVKENILKMEYAKHDDQVLMSKIDLPKGSKVSFDHEKLKRIKPDGSLVEKFPVGEKPTITLGAEYKVVSFTRVGSIYLRIHDNVEKDKTIKLLVGVSAFNYQIIIATRSMFLVLIQTSYQQELVVFHKQDSTWPDKPKRHQISKESTIHLGEKFLGTFEPNASSITIYQWNPEDEKAVLKTKNIVAPNGRPMLRLISQSRMLIAYDDSHLIVFYLDVNGEWKIKNVKSLPGYETETRRTINNFDFVDDVKKQLIASVKENLLQVDGNQIVLTKLQESGGTISVIANLMLLDSNYNVKEQIETISRENVFNFNHEENQFNTKFLLKYKRIDGKLGMRIDDIVSGEIYDELNKIDPRNKQSEKTRVIKEFNDSKNWQDFFKQIFLLDWKQYHARLTPSGLLCGEDIRLKMTGARWIREKSTTETPTLSFAVGPKLVVEQTNPKENELDFYETINGQRTLVHKAMVDGEIANVFPLYLAYQAASDIKVMTFTSEKAIASVKTIHDAKLLQGDMNGMTMLVNSTGLGHSEPQEIQVHPLIDIIPETSEFYINQKTLSSGEMKRVTSFKRSFKVDDDGNVSEKLMMIPGGKKYDYGWYEEIKSLNSTDKTVTKERKLFHSTGELKSKEATQENMKDHVRDEEDESNEKDFSQKIMDLSETLEIADLNPHDFGDENFGYLGFESYESRFIGDPEKNKEWNFPEGNVIHEEFPLTGTSFLRLAAEGEKLEGTFVPKDQQSLFVASCWVRKSSKMMKNQQTKSFEVIVKSKPDKEVVRVQAKVKRQIGEWNYLETLIDLKEVGRQNQNTKDFKITLIINYSGSAIDVDHIRFFPINHDFRVNVFDPSGRTTAVIYPNGSFERKVYNKYEQEIAVINSDGNVVELKSNSETGRLLGPSIKQTRSNKLLFKASQDEYHDPIEYWKKWEIPGSDQKGVWSFSPGQLRHNVVQNHQLEVPGSQINMKSNVVRFDYALNSRGSSIGLNVKTKKIVELKRSSEVAKLSIDGRSFDVPSTGELIMNIEKSRIIIWIDAVHLADFGSSLEFIDDDSLLIDLAGTVALENFCSLKNPIVTVEYFNSWGEPTQIINIETENLAQVLETLHDNLGRRTITTKNTRVIRSSDQPLVAFYENFIANDNYEDPKSVWFTHHLDGDVNELNPKCEGFPYKRVEFEKNPSRDKRAVGLPGKEFSIIGPYSKKIRSETELPILLNLFPASGGFTMYTKINENGSEKVTVFNFQDKKVAEYVKVPGFDHILSIREYDDEGRIVKILPPVYHEKAKTFAKNSPWQFGDDHLSDELKNLQLSLGSHFTYDENGNLLKKSTPDGGTVEYIYDSSDNRRFMKLSNGQIVYFLYDEAEMLIETGNLEDSFNTETLKNMAKSNALPANMSKTVAQEFGYSNKADNPEDRRAIKKFITHNGNDEKVSDEVIFDMNNKLTRKTTKGSADPSMYIERSYEMNKVTQMTYPKENSDDEELNVVFKYDKKGRLSSIGTVDDPLLYAQFTYTADGQIEKEKIQPNSQHEYTRSFDYQSAGYLEKIIDPFITEEMTYTTNGYGQKGFGDGVLSSTAFKATWASTADQRHFKVNVNELGSDKKLMARCFKLLQSSGHLSPIGVVQKSLTFKTEGKLPIECKGKTGYKISKLVAKRQLPKFYGHRYAYGNHQELTKAKYFTDSDEMKAEPLQAGSFKKSVSNLSLEDSHEIWKVLAKQGFIVTDQNNVDFRSAIGKQGKESFVRLQEIEDELRLLSTPTFDTMKVLPGIVNFIVKSICLKNFTTEESFEKEFLAMHGFSISSQDWQIEQLKVSAKKVYTNLAAKDLLPKPSNILPLNPKFTSALRKYSQKIPEILNVMESHWSNDIGESPFDLYSFNIDANGNHRLFYNGYQRYEINYDGDTNKIKNIQLDDISSSEERQTFAVNHDGNGNVVKALHKKIERIEYFITSQRTKRITMTDGQTIEFFYDAMGERILKQVFSAAGDLKVSTKYVRDETGRVLFDKKTVYHPKPQPVEKFTTKYIYGPRGLIGLIRNGSFLSVMTDHAGSIKLMIKDGQVVASYDYLPYGDLMRKFVSSQEYEISYRFTGQEFDEETGLYNYHARLYDPSIGRFYQIDPQGQSFSPYVYSGNSPISFVDPDGEFFFLIAMAVTAVVGAYLSAASANDNWNPIQWDWKSPATYGALAGGAVAGALLPYTAVSVGLTTALVAGSVGVAGSYIGASAANKSLDPTKWNWKSPRTYNAMFEGFSTGFNIVAGIGGIKALSGTFKNVLLKNAFLPATLVGGAGFAYYKGVQVNDGKAAFWEWRWDSEGMSLTFGEMFDGFSTIISVSSSVGKLKDMKFLKKSDKALKQIETVGRIGKLKKLLSKIPKPLVEVVSGVLIVIYRVAEDQDFDFENFNFSELGTYEALINGFFEGRAFVSDAAELKQVLVNSSRPKLQKSTLKRQNAMRSKTSLPQHQLQRQNAMRRVQSRSKRESDGWIITLFIHPDLLQHNIPPEIVPTFAPSPTTDIEGYEKSVVDKSKQETATNIGYVVPSNIDPLMNSIPFENQSNSSTFNVLEMGDQWLQQTDTIGNLTLLHLLVEKFFSTKKNPNVNRRKVSTKGSEEYYLTASEVVNEFVERFMENADKCGFSENLVQLIFENSIDIHTLQKQVGAALKKSNFAEVSQLLMKNVVDKNLKLLRQNGTESKIEALKTLMTEEAKKLNLKLDL